MTADMVFLNVSEGKLCKIGAGEHLNKKSVASLELILPSRGKLPLVNLMRLSRIR